MNRLDRAQLARIEGAIAAAEARIADLAARVAELEAQPEAPVKRGPGRPPKPRELGLVDG